MKYVKQFVIILTISFIGELLHYFLPLPIPASIYGIVILFTLLEVRVIPISAIKETADFLLDIMPILFIPAGVGLLNVWGIIKTTLLQYTFVTIFSTAFVMVVSGKITQFIVRRKDKKNE